MRKRIVAIVLSLLTFLTMFTAVIARPMHASAVTDSEMVKVVVQLLNRSEGTYNSINRNDNGAVSVGILQWHATRALQLMRSVANEDTATAKKLLGNAFYNEVMTASSWETRTFGPAEANAAGALLSTDIGKKKQDNLAASDVQGYINSGKKYGLSNAGVLVYYATLYNRGSGVAARIVNAAKGSGSYGSITLAKLHNTALTDRGNSSGYYTSRLNDAYNTVISLGWADSSVTTPGTTTPSTEPDTSDFSESYAGKYTVSASSLNIRSGPSTSSSKVGSIPNGATVTVTSGNGSWAAVTYNGVSGYCSMDYLKKAAATTTVTTKATTKATTTTTTTTTKATAAATTAKPAATTTAAAVTEAATTTTVTEKASVVGSPNSSYASVYGDVNCDGKVDATDAVVLGKYLNGSVKLTYSQMANADVQLDNCLDTTDLTVILQYLVENLVELPVA